MNNFNLHPERRGFDPRGKELPREGELWRAESLTTGQRVWFPAHHDYDEFTGTIAMIQKWYEDSDDIRMCVVDTVKNDLRIIVVTFDHFVEVLA